MNSPVAEIRRLRSSMLARNAGWMLIGQGLNVVLRAAFNLGLNLWLIPLYGWRGAAWSNLATDGSLGVANWVIARRLPEWISDRRRDAGAR